MERGVGKPNWDEFKRLCHQRFGPPLRTNHLAELACLPFPANVMTYQESFQARMAHAGRLPVSIGLAIHGGLPEHIRIDVELHDP